MVPHKFVTDLNGDERKNNNFEFGVRDLVDSKSVHKIPNSKIKNSFFFFHPNSKQSHIYGVPCIGLSFYDYPGFQPKITPA